MPNFAEGTIKLRGRAENIKSALKYMFEAAGDVTIEEDTDGELIIFTYQTLIFTSMAQNVLLSTVKVLKFILMMIFLSSSLIILRRHGALSQTIT